MRLNRPRRKETLLAVLRKDSKIDEKIWFYFIWPYLDLRAILEVEPNNAAAKEELQQLLNKKVSGASFACAETRGVFICESIRRETI